MELEDQETPQKINTHKFFINYQQKGPNVQSSSTLPSQQNLSNSNKVTPKNAKCLRKSINPRTPKGQTISYSVAACSSLVTANNTIHSLSTAVSQTPPAKRYQQRVKNPFEAALAERLHLPLIASPSLFQRPNTPQLSSTQFEWTIDEVSSLKPANVEPHETQFHDSPDPELEAKAQMAISSYFKEHQIVPSPIDCPLRSQRIVLSEVCDNTPLSRRIRDGSTQTELTLPPVLPLALEEALRPYFQPHLAGEGKEMKKSNFISNCWQMQSGGSSKDISLRRKLFDMHNIVVVENEENQQFKGKHANQSGYSNSSPNSVNSQHHTAIAGKLSDSLDKSSFGSLSPISASDSLSPNSRTENNSFPKSKFTKFLSQIEDIELLSPIHPPVRRKPLSEKNGIEYRNPTAEISTNNITNNDYNTVEDDGDDVGNQHFTPDRASSPLNIMQHNNIAEFSTDSFNVRVSRLKMNSSKSQNNTKERINKHSLPNAQNHSKACDMDLCNDYTQELLENTGEMDDMQISGLSSNCSSSQSDTPRAKRRSANRKNLSQSFSANWLQDDEDSDDLEMSQSLKIKDFLSKKQTNSNVSLTTAIPTASSSDCDGNEEKNDNHQSSLYLKPSQKCVTFYRADSGFNEMSQSSMSYSQDSNNHQQQQQQQQQRKELHQPQQEPMIQS